MQGTGVTAMVVVVVERSGKVRVVPVVLVVGGKVTVMIVVVAVAVVVDFVLPGIILDSFGQFFMATRCYKYPFAIVSVV